MLPLITGGDGDFATADIGGASVSSSVWKAKRERKIDGDYFRRQRRRQSSGGKTFVNRAVLQEPAYFVAPFAWSSVYVSTACALCELRDRRLAASLKKTKTKLTRLKFDSIIREKKNSNLNTGLFLQGTRL